MRVRRAGIDDASSIHALLARPAADGSSGEQNAMVQPGLEDIIQFLQAEEAGAFILEFEGADAGTALFNRQGDVFWLFQLCVRPNARGRGAAKALVRAVEASARGAGASAVFVQLAKHSQGHSFLEALGYHVDNEEADVVAGKPITLVDLVKLV